MRNQNLQKWLGICLVAIGFISFIYQFDIVDVEANLIVGLIFALMGVAFIFSYFQDRRIWKIFAGFALLFISLPIFNETANLFPDELNGTAFLWMFSLVFWIIYIRDRSQWWAVIVGGMLLSIGTLVAADAYRLAEDEMLAVILFIGFSLTFVFLYFIRSAKIRTGWALWPAGLFFGIALIILAEVFDAFDYSEYLVSISIILLGIYMVAKSLIAHKNHPNHLNHAQM